MNELGRLLVWIGLLVVAVGLLVVLAGKIGLPLGRMPGDFVWRGKQAYCNDDATFRRLWPRDWNVE